MRHSVLVVALMSASLAVAGCATNEYSNTSKGAAIGAVLGAVAGKATGNHKDKRLVIGAAVGALAGAAVGSYMDKQEKALKEELSGSGVKVIRDGDKLRLDIPAQLTFDINRADIKANLYPVFNDIAKVLRDYEKTMLVVAGHTDDTGPYQYNMNLSQSRADSVKQYLIAQNVQPIRIETQGYGPNYPLVANSSEANRAQNRRVEIHIEPIVQ
ncbi:MAG: OmpA family protein [Gammaproteobacteria bacterium]|nr:OmpA family protein [Gammaproteobacteria bacterium]MBU1553866.1 OmpA family protein [Gammaproteobacteria bacterium]MBU2069448.1 OmpA family protein [Gammaproteobacteria bacterium]MBU2182952.1 OmpA family protein [Gammaproteobacteria bacterium]MBU2203300.1 OmpA family protein [Gammaproteobacteria bacterium]